MKLHLEDFSQDFRDALNTSSISQESGQAKNLITRERQMEEEGCVCV